MAKSILLADDSATIRKVVELTFSDTGFHVETVSSGAEAMARLETLRPDLVLADDGSLLASASEFGGPSELLRIDPNTGDILEVIATGLDFATGIDEQDGVIYAIEGGFSPQARILVFTPIPEPGTGVLVGAGLQALVRRRMRGKLGS